MDQKTTFANAPHKSEPSSCRRIHVDDAWNRVADEQLLAGSVSFSRIVHHTPHHGDVSTKW